MTSIPWYYKAEDDPCEACGGDARWETSPEGVRLVCQGCGRSTEWADTRLDAARQWSSAVRKAAPAPAPASVPIGGTDIASFTVRTPEGLTDVAVGEGGSYSVRILDDTPVGWELEAEGRSWMWIYDDDRKVLERRAPYLRLWSRAGSDGRTRLALELSEEPSEPKVCDDDVLRDMGTLILDAGIPPREALAMVLVDGQHLSYREAAVEMERLTGVPQTTGSIGAYLTKGRKKAAGERCRWMPG